MRDYNNRKPDEIENVLIDATVQIRDKIIKILEERLVSAIKDSNVETVRFLLKNRADTNTWGERERMLFIGHHVLQIRRISSTPF